jgi:uncharacterized protein with HEPN domain
MPKTDLAYLGHMYDAACNVVEKMRGKDRAAFDADENLRLAIAYLVQNIGESARRVSEAGKQTHSQIPWKQIIGMRHKIVHDYLDVDFDIVYAVATADLPALVTLLEKIVPAES